MAVDMFIKIGDIKGEAQDSAHKEEIDVLAWSWGASQSGTMKDASGQPSGKASFQDLSFTKWVDVASPKLLKAVSTGEQIEKVLLTVRKAGGTDAHRVHQVCPHKLPDHVGFHRRVRRGGSADGERHDHLCRIPVRVHASETGRQAGRGDALRL